MIKPVKTLTFIFASAVMTHAFGQGASTLCSKGEDVYFSCPLLGANKIASICASENSDPNHGYVQYRYGTPEKIDFKYPKNISSPPGGNFQLSDVSEGSIRGLHMKFSNGDFHYVISSTSPGGVYVVKNGKKIFDKECDSGPDKSFSMKSYKGIKQLPPSDIDDIN